MDLVCARASMRADTFSGVGFPFPFAISADHFLGGLLFSHTLCCCLRCIFGAPAGDLND